MKTKMTTSTILILIFIGIAAGIFSGLIGVGGGLIMIPLFLMLLGLTQYQAQGLSLAVMLPPVTLLAALNYHKAGAIDWKMALIVSSFFIIGGYFGSKIALKIDQQTLKRVFGVVILIVSLKMIFGK